MELRFPVQPTVRPPWSSWPGWESARGDLLDRYQRQRFRLTLHNLGDSRNAQNLRPLNMDWSHIPRQEIAVFVPNSLRHLIKFDPPKMATGRGPTGYISEDAWRSDANPWRMPDIQIPQIRLETVPGDAAAGAATRPTSARHWEGATRAWAGGALVLAVIVLLVRAAEKCLHRKFFKARRPSEEWPRPNVYATSQRHENIDIPSIPRFEDSEGFNSESNQDSVNIDLPPPYSECANTEGIPNITANKYIGPEEPPPPYSACYVAFSNPKDGIPSVHFYNRQNESLFTESGSTSSQERGETSYGVQLVKPDNNDTGESCNNELLFQNGRIVERNKTTQIVDEEINTLSTQNNVQEVSDRDQNNVEHVVEIGEPNSANLTEDRSLQV